MTFSFKNLFCCFTSPEIPQQKESGSKTAPTNNSAPQRASRPEKAESRKPPRPDVLKPLPETPPTHSSPKLNSSNNASQREPGPEELTVKGKRMSASISQPSPIVTNAENKPDLTPEPLNENGRRYGVSPDIELHEKSAAENDNNVLLSASDVEQLSTLNPNEPIPEIGEIEESGDMATGLSGDLLPPPVPELGERKCLVLDLDETLVHSSFKYIWNADFVIPVEIEGTVHDVYVVKRPGVDEFLERVSEIYEVVVFTASVAKYGDPLLDRLDPFNYVHHRLFRESCFNFHGNYIKNLSWLGRPLESVIIVDNSPAAYILQPRNAVPVSSWFSDVHDNELMDMLPFLEDLAGQAVPSVLNVLGHEW